MEFASREALLDFAEKHQIPIAKDKRGEAPFSVDANLLHSSSEGKVLEDPSAEPAEYVHQRTISPEDAPDEATIVTIDFERGDPVAIDGERLSPAALLTGLNQLGHDNGIGRLDLVENRFVGMKSRGVYETPGGTILLAARRGIESITLDGGAMHLKDELMPRYAGLIYNGFWFSPEREMLQAAIDRSQEHVSGRVRVKLYKGNATVVARESAESLYDQDLVTFEEGSGSYDHHDAAGFIRLNALRLRTIAQRKRRLEVLALPSRSLSYEPMAPRDCRYVERKADHIDILNFPRHRPNIHRDRLRDRPEDAGATGSERKPASKVPSPAGIRGPPADGCGESTKDRAMTIRHPRILEGGNDGVNSDGCKRQQDNSGAAGRAPGAAYGRASADAHRVGPKSSITYELVGNPTDPLLVVAGGIGLVDTLWPASAMRVKVGGSASRTHWGATAFSDQLDWRQWSIGPPNLSIRPGASDPCSSRCAKH